MEQPVILLNGPSSSGKSTLAKALRERIRERRKVRAEIVSIDDYLKMSPKETIYEDDVFAISGDLCQKALEIRRTGAAVILDHVITSERIYTRLMEELATWPVLTVRVTCPLPVLREREKRRGDRKEGSAEASETYLFPKEGYDLVVDTGEKTAEENAEKLYAFLFGEEETMELRPITQENFLEAFRLRLAPGQEEFVSGPVRSLAQAYVYRDQCQPFGIYAQGKMVGYVMVIYDYDIPEYDIWHMMIDESEQGKGYGGTALDLVLDYIRTKPFGESGRVALTCHKDNLSARRLYEKKGFAPTGAEDGDEIEMVLNLWG